MHILVTGGLNSGKLPYAEARAIDLSLEPICINTCETEDEISLTRLAEARARRGKHWSEITAPINLAGALTNSDSGKTRLVDNLTVWVANLFYNKRDWRVQLGALVRALDYQRSPVIFVADEIGMGLMPDDVWADEFVDAVGRVNQELVSVVGSAYFVVAGCPIKIK